MVRRACHHDPGRAITGGLAVNMSEVPCVALTTLSAALTSSAPERKVAAYNTLPQEVTPQIVGLGLSRHVTLV